MHTGTLTWHATGLSILFVNACLTTMISYDNFTTLNRGDSGDSSINFSGEDSKVAGGGS